MPKAGDEVTERPWRSYQRRKPGQVPEKSTLAMWRRKAQALAKKLGFAAACDLCKRPILKAHRFGFLWLRPPRAWRSRLYRRRLCHSCYLVIDSLVMELEMNGARDHLPPEDFVEQDDSAAEHIEQQQDAEPASEPAIDEPQPNEIF